jgi:hypothetical protein
MPSQVLVDSGYPRLPFVVNDVGQDSLFSITVASGTDVLPGGTVLGKVAATGKYAPYDDGGSGGVETAAGILLNRIDPTNGDELGSMLIMGVVRSGSLFGIDANAMADLANHFYFV